MTTEAHANLAWYFAWSQLTTFLHIIAILQKTDLWRKDDIYFFQTLLGKQRSTIITTSIRVHPCAHTHTRTRTHLLEDAQLKAWAQDSLILFKAGLEKIISVSSSKLCFIRCVILDHFFLLIQKWEQKSLPLLGFWWG